MSDVVFIDTSVYLNILDVTGFNQSKDDVLSVFEGMAADYLILPLATIFETGNHISKLPDENQRLKFAQTMINHVCGVPGKKPLFQPIQMPSTLDFTKWLAEFPNYAKVPKKAKKAKTEGGSLSDLTIKREWKKACDNKLFRHRRVRIWSLDSDLSSCDRKPQKGM